MEKYKDTFSKIKFRASWGLTGNDQLDGRRFAFLPTIDTDGSYNGESTTIITVLPVLKENLG